MLIVWKTHEVRTIDDGRHGEDDAVAVVDDRIHRFVFNNMEEVLQVIVCLPESEELLEQQRSTAADQVSNRGPLPCRGSSAGRR